MASRLMNLKKGETFKGELRFAILGTGFWSTLQIPAWREVPQVKCVAAYNRTVAKAEKAAEQYGIPHVYGDAEEMLKKEELDFIDIITEIPVHASLTALAVKYKIPVICQKPMAPDYTTCKTMVDSCRTAGVPLLIHENYRWQPPIRSVKTALLENRIGKVIRANIQLSNFGEESLQFQPFLKTIKHFALTDMGAHIFDVARFYFGEAESVYCLPVHSFDSIAGEDTFSAVLKMGDLVCTCEVGYRLGYKVFVEGKKGSIELKNDGKLLITDEKGTEVRENPSPHFPYFNQETENFIGKDVLHSIVLCNQHMHASLCSGTPAETSGEDNLKTMRLMHGAIESAEKEIAISL